MSQRELGYARPDGPSSSPVLGPFLGEDHFTNLLAIAAADFFAEELSRFLNISGACSANHRPSLGIYR